MIKPIKNLPNEKKMQSKPKIIFFDIDDTLYIKVQNRIPDSTITALQQLKAQGIIIAIATGRGLGVFPPTVYQLINTVGIDLLVTINGQYVRYQGETLVHYPLKNEQIEQVTDYLVHEKIAYAYMTAEKIFALSESFALKNSLNSLRIPYTLVEPNNFDKSLPIYQILAFYDDNSTVQLHLPDSLKTVRWHLSGVDILDKNGSKARGIEYALKKLGLSFTDAWAFGDGLNDIEMLQSVGFGVAMGNAHPDLKVVADFVCPAITDDGIYQGLKNLGVI